MKKHHLILGFLAGGVMIGLLAYFAGLRTAQAINHSRIQRLRDDRTTAILRQMNSALAIGAKLPDAELTDLEGTTIHLSEAVCRATLIIYIETECGHCRNELKLIGDNFLTKTGPCCVLISDGSPKELREYHTSYGAGCRILWDADSRYKKELGVFTFPFNIMVDESLLIHQIVSGELAEEDLQELAAGVGS